MRDYILRFHFVLNAGRLRTENMVPKAALRVHRITPRIDYLLSSKSTMRRLSLVSQKVCRMTREVYYRINVVKCLAFAL
jgi:hypothetical protein